MLKKLVYVALLVSDQDKALDFYTNVIGLEKRVDSPTPVGPRFLTVGVEGQDFELVLWPGTPARADLPPSTYGHYAYPADAFRSIFSGLPPFVTGGSTQVQVAP
jgi:catechol 2,3-dioxygenase-like lactoylglutathione lyase family enzyme